MVDAVITWVDGDDPAHAAKRLHHLGLGLEPGADGKGVRPTRFAQSGEIWFCPRLIRKFAPWIDEIFLVTDDQRPSWLTAAVAEELGVTVVDHTTIFAGLEDYLPVFSSRSIETLLHRIPGLADEFVYFNDDVFLIHPLKESDYFDGVSCLMRGTWRQPISAPRKLARELMSTLARYHPGSSHRDGYCGRRAERHMLEEYADRYFALAHTPFPVSKPFMKRVMDDSGLYTNARFRFRNERQFNPMAYLTHVGLSQGVVAQGPDDWEYVNCAAHTSRVIEARLRRCENDPSIKSLCVQSMEMGGGRARRRIEAFLTEALER